MRKKRNSVVNPSKQFLIIVKGDFIRLKKGMGKKEVINILGEPFKTEDCNSEINEKLFFKINDGRLIRVTYSVLFTADELVYAAKIN